MFTFPVDLMGGALPLRVNVGSYTGNGTSQVISTSENMDMLFLMGNTLIEKPVVFRDRVNLYTPLYDNGIEVASATVVTSYGDKSFTLGSNVLSNAAAVGYDWYGWRKVPTYFNTFSYVGNGTTQAIAHGLGGGAPQMIVVKRATGSGQHGIMWDILNTDSTNTMIAYSISQNAGDMINTVTTSTFSVSSAVEVNANGATYTGYVFGAVPGASIVGQYTGNGSVTGPVVNTGFAPKLVYIVNRATNGTAAGFYSTTHVGNNYPNGTTPQARASAGTVSLTSSGFQPTSTTTGLNGNGVVHFYAAWA